MKKYMMKGQLSDSILVNPLDEPSAVCVSKDEFLKYLSNEVEKRDRIEDISFDGKTLRIKKIVLNQVTKVYETYEYEVGFSDIPDMRVFSSGLADIVKRYEELATETRANIATIVKENNVMVENYGEAKQAIIDYAKTGCLPNWSREKAAAILLVLRRKGNSLANSSLPAELDKIKKPRFSNYSKRMKSRFNHVFCALFAITGVTLEWSVLTFLQVLNHIQSLTALVLPGVLSFAGLFFTVSGVDFALRNFCTSVIDDLASHIEKVYDLSSNDLIDILEPSKSETKDRFLEFIKTDLSYIEMCGLKNYREELYALDKLSSDYIESAREAIKTGGTVDKYSFLARLTQIEANIFTKENGIGLKTSDKLGIQKTLLKDRLEFLGLGHSAVENPVMKLVEKQIQKIVSMPYIGCELQVMDLLRIAQEYIRKTSEVQPEGLSIENALNDFLAEEVKIELDISTKQSRAQQYTSLQNDYSAIEEALRSSILGMSSKAQSEEQPTTGEEGVSMPL